MSPARVLLVGAGAVSQIFYLPILARGIAGLRLAGIVDPAPHADALAQGTPVYCRSFEEVLGDADVMAGVDSVLVALPHHLHVRCVNAALSKGKHVFCEKPLAMSKLDLDAIDAADPERTRVLAVCQPRRHFAAAESITRIVQIGALGKPVRVTWNEGQPYRWPAASITQILGQYGGSELFDIGAHVFDLLCWWFGPLDVVAYSDDAAGGTAAEFSIGLRSQNGLPIKVQLSRLHRLENRCQIEFERGALCWRLGTTDSVELIGGELSAMGLVKLTSMSHAPTRMIDAIAEDLRLFGAAMAGGTSPGASLEDARLVAAIFDACAARSRAPRNSLDVGGGAGYLVTGAAGFIGCALVEALVSRGERVTALVHTPKNSVRLARLGAPMVKADILRPDSFAAFVPRDGIVVHCAVSHADPRASVVDGTMVVLKAAKAAGARRVVILSSMLAMGDPPLEGDVDESTQLQPSSMAYAAAKRAMERAALEFGRASGLEIVILRPTCVFGPYGSDFGSAHLDAMVAKSYFHVDEGRGRANLVYVDNLVDAILLAASAPGVDGACFIVNEDEHAATWREYFGDLARTAFGSEPEWPSFSRSEVSGLKEEWARRNRFPGVLRNAVRAHPAAREWLAANPLFRAWQSIRRRNVVAASPTAVGQSIGEASALVLNEDRKLQLREQLVGGRRCYYDASYGALFASRAVYCSTELRRQLGWTPRVRRSEAMDAMRNWVRRTYAVKES